MNRNDIPEMVLAWWQALSDEDKLRVSLLISTGREDLSGLNDTGLDQLFEEYEWAKVLLTDKAPHP